VVESALDVDRQEIVFLRENGLKLLGLEMGKPQPAGSSSVFSRSSETTSLSPVASSQWRTW